MTPALETVYYPRATPLSHDSLTFMALVFERVHFPGVFIPKGEFDRERLKASLAQALQDPKPVTPRDALVLNALRFALHNVELRDFCVFSENPDGLTDAEEKHATSLTEEIVRANGGVLPSTLGSDYSHWTEIHLENGAMRFPSALEYPANALLYAATRKIPVLNDDTRMPVLSGIGAPPKDNVATLSAFLATECVRLALPQIPRLSIPEMVQIRRELRAPLVDFRNAMVRLSTQLNGRIRGGESAEEIRRYAQFVVETNVSPIVSDLESSFREAKQPFLKRAFECAKMAPELVTAFSTLSPVALGKAFGALGSILVDAHSVDQRKIEDAKRTGYYYILKLREIARGSA